MHRRVVSVWFPRLPADRLLRSDLIRAERPFAVVREEKSALRLYALNKAAEAVGLAPAMALSDARAIYPGLATQLAEIDRDLIFLGALHRWAGRFSPHIASDGADGLLLDITGCAHLFGGEAAMLSEMHQQFTDLRVETHLGCADTKGAAWALAHEACGVSIAPPGETMKAITRLSLGALRLPRDILGDLNKLGLAQIGDLSSIPRASLARRFGLELVQRLDQATGMRYEPVAPVTPPRIFAARMSLPEPIGLLDDVREVLRRTVLQICRRLDEAQYGARAFRMTVRRVDHSDEVIEIGLATPSRDADLVLRLFERRLEKLDAGFGIEMIRTQAVKTEPLSARQLSGEPSVRADSVIDEVVARLGNRIGFSHVKRFAPAESHIPERAFITAPAKDMNGEAARWKMRERTQPRPLMLFAPETVHPLSSGRPPRAFAWRGRKIDLHHAVGPERIAPEWWRSNAEWGGSPKDYWRIEATDGERLWLCCDHSHSKKWAVCGEFP